MNNYCDHLYFQIGEGPNNRHELIISAEEDTDFFEEVKELVIQAPKIKGWQIVVFRPQPGVDIITEYEDIVQDPNVLWFFPLNNDKNYF